MRQGDRKHFLCAGGLLILILSLTISATAATLNLGVGQPVQIGGSDITVPGGYSVPSFAYYDNDDKMDLIVGYRGDATNPASARVYLNVGTQSGPQFSNDPSKSFLIQVNNPPPTDDLSCNADGCMGCFPRILQKSGETYKCLIVGQSDGTVKAYGSPAQGADSLPYFIGSGNYMKVGPTIDTKVNIDVGDRATPTAVDWDNDGHCDLVIGALDGKIRVYINEGTSDITPDFHTEMIVQAGDSDLIVPSDRSSPVIMDLDGDDKKDILTGNTDGQLLLYSNIGTNAAPVFSTYEYVKANGVNIDLMSTRSRPFVCDWTNDGLLDVLIGASDGKVYLYQGVPEPATIGLIALSGLHLLRRRRRSDE